MHTLISRPGLTTDIRFFAESLHGAGLGPVSWPASQLGANMVTKLAGELGSDGRRLLVGIGEHQQSAGFARLCVGAEPQAQSWLYLVPVCGAHGCPVAAAARPYARSVPARCTAGRGEPRYQLMNRITAPFFGFGDAPGYYGTQSSQLFLDAIEIPALFLHSQDDPMIPFRVYRHGRFRRRGMCGCWRSSMVAMLASSRAGTSDFGGSRCWWSG